ILLMGQAFAQPETADSEATQEQESAALMEGVDRENSELLISDDVNERLEGVWANLHARLLGLVSSLPLVLVAVAIVLVFWLLSWTITRWNAPYRRLTKNVFLQALLKRL